MAGKEPKKKKKKKSPAAKTVKAMELMDQGLNIHDAHKLATGIDKPHPNTIYDLKKKYDKYLLSKQSTVKLASKVFVETMKMKPVTTEEIKQCPQCKGKSKDPEQPMCDTCNGQGVVATLLYPTHSNRLDAAKEVMDRIDPVVKKSMNVNANIHAFVDFEGEASSLLEGLG